MLAGGEDKFDKFYTHNDWQTCGLGWQTCGGEDGEGLLKPTTPILGHCLDSLGISDPPGRRLKNTPLRIGDAKQDRRDRVFVPLR